MMLYGMNEVKHLYFKEYNRDQKLGIFGLMSGVFLTKVLEIYSLSILSPLLRYCIYFYHLVFGMAFLTIHLVILLQPLEPKHAFIFTSFILLLPYKTIFSSFVVQNETTIKYQQIFSFVFLVIGAGSSFNRKIMTFAGHLQFENASSNPNTLERTNYEMISFI